MAELKQLKQRIEAHEKNENGLSGSSLRTKADVNKIEERQKLGIQSQYAEKYATLHASMEKLVGLEVSNKKILSKKVRKIIEEVNLQGINDMPEDNGIQLTKKVLAIEKRQNKIDTCIKFIKEAKEKNGKTTSAEEKAFLDEMKRLNGEFVPLNKESTNCLSKEEQKKFKELDKLLKKSSKMTDR